MAILKDTKKGIGIVSTLCDSCDHADVCIYHDMMYHVVATVTSECEGKIFGPKDWYCDKYNTATDVDKLRAYVASLNEEEREKLNSFVMEAHHDDANKPE